MITLKEAATKAIKKDKTVYAQGETKDAYIFFPRSEDITIDDTPCGVAVYKETGKAVKLSTYEKNGGNIDNVKILGFINETEISE